METESILLHARYPDMWKQSHVVSIFKGGDKTSVSCGRPISILPKLSLVFEEVIFRQLYPTMRSKSLKDTVWIYAWSLDSYAADNLP